MRTEIRAKSRQRQLLAGFRVSSPNNILGASAMRAKLILLMTTIFVGAAGSAAAADTPASHHTVIRHGLIYDGSGKQGYIGDVAIDGDKISYVGPHAPGKGRSEIDA